MSDMEVKQRSRTTRLLRQLLLVAGLGVVVVLVLSGGRQRDQARAGESGASSVRAADAAPTDPLKLSGKRHVGEQADPGYNQRVSLTNRGRLVYNDYCVGCHGKHGDGNGDAAARLLVKPRDFTSGVYKFRSTDSGSLPLDTDLHRTITHGLARVSMPAFPLIPEQDKVAVIAYIKSFYPKWESEAANNKTVYVPVAPNDLGDVARVARGRVVYLAMGCGNCHGGDGAGKGATQTEYKDAWGNMVKAFNFTKGRLKGGDDPEDVYRTFHTGLRSVMPSFGGTTLATATRDAAMAADRFLAPGEAERLAAALDEFPKGSDDLDKLNDAEKLEAAQRNSWDLVAYILSLRGKGAVAAK